MNFWTAIWDVIGFMFWTFVFIAALIAVWTIISDLVRDKSLSGWAKAAWMVPLVLLPLITALVYFIARGDGMAERASKDVAASQQATEEYIRSVVHPSSPVDEISRAKALLDVNAITQEEFELIKQRALAASHAG